MARTARQNCPNCEGTGYTRSWLAKCLARCACTVDDGEFMAALDRILSRRPAASPPARSAA